MLKNILSCKIIKERRNKQNNNNRLSSLSSLLSSISSTTTTVVTQTNKNAIASFYDNELCELKLLWYVCDFVCGQSLKSFERKKLIQSISMFFFI